MHFPPSTTVATILILRGSSTFSIALIISESLPTPDGSIIILSGANFSTISFIDLEKSPTSEQQIQPELISLISTPLSFRNAPSTPISPNSFSMRTTFSFLSLLSKSFFIKVVFPAPRKPEITSILIINYTSFILFAAPSVLKRTGRNFTSFIFLKERLFRTSLFRRTRTYLRQLRILCSIRPRYRRTEGSSFLPALP